MKNKLEDLVRRTRSMFESKFPHVELDVRAKIGYDIGEVTHIEDGVTTRENRTYYTVRLIVNPTCNKWLPDIIDSMEISDESLNDATKQAFEGMLRAINLHKKQYAKQQDKYFESIG